MLRFAVDPEKLVRSDDEPNAEEGNDRMESFSNSAVFSYKIRVGGKEYPVCFKAFLKHILCY